ncbi:hypothetical protein BJV74DRAFT_841147 [Russula compacta]|nr:hypothetical protein BJV74DRAFT_841147 [Russula compacta]
MCGKSSQTSGRHPLLSVRMFMASGRLLYCIPFQHPNPQPYVDAPIKLYTPRDSMSKEFVDVGTQTEMPAWSLSRDRDLWSLANFAHPSPHLYRSNDARGERQRDHHPPLKIKLTGYRLLNVTNTGLCDLESAIVLLWTLDPYGTLIGCRDISGRHIILCWVAQRQATRGLPGFLPGRLGPSHSELRMSFRSVSLSFIQLWHCYDLRWMSDGLPGVGSKYVAHVLLPSDMHSLWLLWRLAYAYSQRCDNLRRY